jgi:hypothetical protein
VSTIPSTVDIESGTARVVVTPRLTVAGEQAVRSAPDLEAAVIAACRALGTPDALELVDRLTRSAP